jgi:hypothetical protein
MGLGDKIADALEKWQKENEEKNQHGEGYDHDGCDGYGKDGGLAESLGTGGGSDSLKEQNEGEENE